MNVLLGTRCSQPACVCFIHKRLVRCRAVPFARPQASSARLYKSSFLPEKGRPRLLLRLEGGRFHGGVRVLTLFAGAVVVGVARALAVSSSLLRGHSPLANRLKDRVCLPVVSRFQQVFFRTAACPVPECRLRGTAPARTCAALERLCDFLSLREWR